MMQATTIPPDKAEVVTETADALEAQAGELLEMARLLRDEIDFTGELAEPLLRRLEAVSAASQASIGTLRALAD